MTAREHSWRSEETAGVAVSADSPFRSFWSDFSESPVAMAALVGLALIVAAAALAPVITPQNPYDLAEITILDSMLPPGGKNLEGKRYWLGTDDQGRDMLSGILYGLRTSVFVGIFSGIIAFFLGTTLGLMAAYFGGAIDSVIMRLVDLKLGFPSILVALLIVTVLGKGMDKIIIALVIVQWAYYARAARSAALVERGKEYVEATRILGLSHRRTIFCHILPNCLPPLIVVGTVEVAHAIILEATLSFLGVGLPITEPSLGLLIANGYQYMLSGKYWISFNPGLALFVTILCINLVGDQLRDVLNPRLRR